MKAFLDYINEITNTEPFIITHTFYNLNSNFKVSPNTVTTYLGSNEIHLLAHKELYLGTLSSYHNFTLSRNSIKIGKRFLGSKNSIFNVREYKFLKKLRFI